nr:ParB N-terminal domain-containing protein [Paludisphaera borealis]
MIDSPKADKELRHFNKEFAFNLAASIKIEGMHNPIMIRPNPDAAGRYLIVQGRHRLYAKKTVLKEDVIEARVSEDMDETDAEMAMLSENLWRNPLTRAQHFITLRKWSEHYQAKRTGKIGPGATGSKASAEKKAKAKAQASDSFTSNRAAAPAIVEEPSSTGLDAMVAALTGKSLASARRVLRIARSFDTEQLEALEQMQVTQGDMTRLAKIKDEHKRGEVVNLIAAGMEVEDALKRIMGEAAPTPADGKSRETREAEAAKADAGKDSLDDEAWFTEFCGQKAAMLKNPAKYKADAILFRKLAQIRQTFRTNSKKPLKVAKKAGAAGPFLELASGVASVSHPKEWLVCKKCKGAGMTRGSECKNCQGGGYLVTHQERH